jgi:biopolymer transport protein ExbD
MKKIVFCVMVVFLSLAFFPLQSKAATTEEPSSLPAPKPAESAEAKTLLLRLDEIKAMDMSKLKSEEKKNLRKEVKSIKHNLRDIGTGVYLSGAAIILIVILLIVLL